MRRIRLLVWWPLLAAGLLAAALAAGCAKGQKSAGEKTAAKAADGLTVEDVVTGTGVEAKSGDFVQIELTQRLYVNGAPGDTVFSSARRGGTVTLPLREDDRLPRGLVRGVVGMKAGGRRHLVIPPALAYGERGALGIPPNSSLWCDVTLRGVPRVEMREIVRGEGAEALEGDVVEVHYTGWLNDNGQRGRKFDSSLDRNKPFPLQIGVGHVIPGWEIGLVGMRVGGKRELIIPPELAYGEQGVGPIPPNATLIFEVELLKVQGK